MLVLFMVDLFVILKERRIDFLFCKQMEETKKRRVIGLVGGICSMFWFGFCNVGGKSTVSRILKEKGCYCIDCDKLGHKVYISFISTRVVVIFFIWKNQILLDFRKL